MNFDHMLDTLRIQGGRAIAALCVLLAIIAITVAALGRPDDLVLTVVACALVTVVPVTVAIQQRIDTQALMSYGAALPMYTLLLIYLLRGDPWQMDMHMLIFASLAVLTVLCEWRAVMLAAVIGALHHAGLTFFYSDFAFFGGASFGRLIVHAAVVLAETAVLCWLAKQLPSLLSDLAAQSEMRRNAEAIAAAERAQTFETQRAVVDALSTALSEVASGNLATDIEQPFPGEYEKLRLDFNDTCTRLSSSISTLSQGIREMESDFQAIAAGTDDSASRYSEQAAMLTQTAASVDNMARAMADMQTFATEMSKDVARSQALAEQGNAVAEATRLAMNEAMESANRINAIVELIEGIAFQTNLLALNAGVESARAGEAGAGFSIIAAEVRALSMRTSESVKNVRAFTQESRDRMETGVSYVSKSVETLTAITDSVAAARTRVDEMVRAVADQAARFSEVNTAVNEIDRCNQLNAAGAEETSAAASRVQNSAQKLVHLTEVYRTEKELAGARAQQARLGRSFAQEEAA